MINFSDQMDLFKLMGVELDRKVECLVIGGSAMMFYGAKESTKDVDLVLMKKKDFFDIKKILKKIGFEERKKVIKIFKHYEVAKIRPVFMEGRDTRFDLFLNEVICFKINENILNRVKEVHEFGNLIVNVISPEDIILMKCATERERDREDAVRLIEKFNINWDYIIEESVEQTKIGETIFPVFLYDFLIELKEDLKVDIPDKVIKKIRKIGEEEMIKRFKK